MVSEMSGQVQFLFVTHNKATMEAAQQLSDVTMRDPGVSRLVSVDLAAAARLAGAAEGEPQLSDAWLLLLGFLVAGVIVLAANYFFGKPTRQGKGSRVVPRSEKRS